MRAGGVGDSMEVSIMSKATQEKYGFKKQVIQGKAWAWVAIVNGMQVCIDPRVDSDKWVEREVALARSVQ